MTPTRQITILLEEYRTLRAEILNRTSNGYQLLAIGAGVPAALFAWISWTDPPKVPWAFWVAVGILAVAFLFLVIALYHDIIRATDRLSELELKINNLAGPTTLLEWETNGGGGAVTRIIRKVWHKKSTWPSASHGS